MEITATPTIRVLIVDNSPAARERLRLLFDNVSDIEVVGEAGTAERAMRLLDQCSPNAILVDCNLPSPGSFEVVKEMMGLYCVPIIMLSKYEKSVEASLEAKALDSGAVALITWPSAEVRAGRGSQEELIRAVRAMSEVRVVRRRGSLSKRDALSRRTTSDLSLDSQKNRIDIIAIGASTGGPPALQTVLCGLPRPLVVVQHLSPGFQNSLVAWLGEASGLPVKPAEHGAPLRPGVVYVAPDNRHMSVEETGRLLLTDDPPENGSRPSVSVLFRSVAQIFGPHAIGVILTGMGRDGAKELRLMRDKGAITIAQDAESSIVHGMPGEAIRIKGARYIIPPDRMPSVIEHHLSSCASQ
jgi:two-component system chemotaxis response regulator CheB